MKHSFSFHKIPLFVLIGTVEEVSAEVTEPGIYYACHTGDPEKLKMLICEMLDRAFSRQELPAGFRSGVIPLSIPAKGKYTQADIDALIAKGINPLRLTPEPLLAAWAYQFVDEGLRAWRMMQSIDFQTSVTSYFKEFAETFDSDFELQHRLMRLAELQQGIPPELKVQHDAMTKEQALTEADKLESLATELDHYNSMPTQNLWARVTYFKALAATKESA